MLLDSVRLPIAKELVRIVVVVVVQRLEFVMAEIGRVTFRLVH